MTDTIAMGDLPPYFRKCLQHRPQEQHEFALEMLHVGFDTRLVNCFLNFGFKSLDQICRFAAIDLLRIPHLGRKSLKKMEKLLAESGRSLAQKSRLSSGTDDRGDDGMTEEQQSTARLADRGDDWALADRMQSSKTSDALRQALHDRDRFQREAAYWREQCIKLRGEALA